MNPEKFQLDAIPRSLLDDPFREIRAFSTVFILDGKVVGSGTFVRLNGIAGILTAHHVWDLIVASGHQEVGLQIMDQRHRFVIPIKLLVPAYGIRGKSEAFGPDIIFLKVPLAKLGEIEARKVFYNLSLQAQLRRKKARNRYGLYIASGAPESRSKQDGNLTTIFVLGSILGRTRVRWKSGYDYWELKTISREKGKVESFGGMSGGGVWKVILQKKRGQEISAAKILGVYLCGVAFYESGLRGDWRFLRMHGPHTLYRRLPRLSIYL